MREIGSTLSDRRSRKSYFADFESWAGNGRRQVVSTVALFHESIHATSGRGGGSLFRGGMVQSGGMVTLEESDDMLAPGDPVGRLMQRIDAVKASFETFGASLAAEGGFEEEEDAAAEDGYQPALAPAPIACWLRNASHLPPSVPDFSPEEMSWSLDSSQRSEALPGFAGRSEKTRMLIRRWRWRARSRSSRQNPAPERDKETSSCPASHMNPAPSTPPGHAARTRICCGEPIPGWSIGCLAQYPALNPRTNLKQP